MDLSKLVVEGFETKFLRAALDKLGESYMREEKSISLLEKLVATKNPYGGPATLEGLRTVQYIRSKVKGHAGSSEGKAIVQDVLAQHGTYAEHFKQVCALIVDDLQSIEAALST